MAVINCGYVDFEHFYVSTIGSGFVSAVTSTSST